MPCFNSGPYPILNAFEDYLSDFGSDNLLILGKSDRILKMLKHTKTRLRKPEIRELVEKNKY